MIGPGQAQEADPDEVRRLVQEGLAAGELKPSALAKQVAGATGLGREEVYQIILASRAEAEQDGDKAVIHGDISEEEPRERRLPGGQQPGPARQGGGQDHRGGGQVRLRGYLEQGRRGGRRLQRAVHSGPGRAQRQPWSPARAEGPQAMDALNALDKLFAGLFGEGR